jgi:hypothetical protein
MSYSAEYKLQRVMAVVDREYAIDRELYAKLKANELTLEEYISASPRYDGHSDLPALKIELGIED